MDYNRFDLDILTPRWTAIAIMSFILGVGYFFFLDYSSGQALEVIMQG